MTPKIARFLEQRTDDLPCLVVDLDEVGANYRRLAAALPTAHIYYAVKANPATDILRLLVDLGSRFDAASRYEVDQCLEAGAAPEVISFGNTVKKKADIAHAYGRGVRLFAFDSQAELDKLAEAAPGSRVFCRIQVPSEGAEWPMARKFGCSVEMARDLMIDAARKGLEPWGISFHLGSQQTDPSRWDAAISRTAMLFSDLRDAGIELGMINLGGGFPARYRDPVPEIEAYAVAITQAMTRAFGNALPEMVLEPGRAIVADAGVLDSAVVLVSRKSYEDNTRWVYLDVGKFGGLAETDCERIKYRVSSPRHDGVAPLETGPVVLAGPTCDGTDIMYEQVDYRLPLDLDAGDRLRFMSAGAYTTTYSSVGFNGFPPLQTYCV
ncbi:MAG: type III PLP-dependent enzyme [Acetobacterales bacterium]